MLRLWLILIPVAAAAQVLDFSPERERAFELSVMEKIWRSGADSAQIEHVAAAAV